MRPWLHLLALRSVAQPTWTNNVADHFCAPWGAGLCCPQRFAIRFSQLVRELKISKVVGRHGQNLFCGEDDLFSWLSVGSDTGFGIFPELRITHLIPAGRLRQDYLVRLVYGHSFSHAVLRYMVYGTNPRPATALRHLRIIGRGLKNGWFSTRCGWAELRGKADATEFISKQPAATLPLHDALTQPTVADLKLEAVLGRVAAASAQGASTRQYGVWSQTEEAFKN